MNGTNKDNKTYYKDIYGCSASITKWRDKFILKVSNGYRVFYKKMYDTFKGARIAMGRIGDGWEEK